MKKTKITKKPPEDHVSVLIGAKTAQDAIRARYAQLARSRKISLRALAKRIGISSSGYISDIMSGRRVLARKYNKKFAAALGWHDRESDYFCLLLDLDHEPEASTKKLIQNEMVRLKRIITQVDRLLHSDVSEIFFAAELFSAFGLFGNEATCDQLVSYYGEHKRRPILRAIKILRDFDVVDKVDERKFRIVRPLVHFTTGANQMFYEQLMAAALRNATGKVKQWYSKPETSLFSSSVVSVNKAKFKTRLPEIKSMVLNLVGEMETPEADSLIRFNVQIFPE